MLPLESQSAERYNDVFVIPPDSMGYFSKFSFIGLNLAIKFPDTPTQIKPPASSVMAKQLLEGSVVESFGSFLKLLYYYHHICSIHLQLKSKENHYYPER